MNRFGPTILKAKQVVDTQSHPVQTQQEKERLHAEIRAAEAATRLWEEAELKAQRQREREAARDKLEKMEKACCDFALRCITSTTGAAPLPATFFRASCGTKDQRAVELVAEAVEVAHADLAEVARMVLVEEDAVMQKKKGKDRDDAAVPLFYEVNYIGKHIDTFILQSAAMGHKRFSFRTIPFVMFLSAFHAYGQLDYGFYDRSCPHLPRIVTFGVWAAFRNETRIAAHLFFGCTFTIVLSIYLLL
ncbi:hypothetical protein RJ639_042133 [Escallonia herrerae]|uniref:Uncharacterized protein n=1 Tax=Escallonia herrerae TaxID=1293975 RepID=A0AA89B2U9_9ASTE|nr:hypothetical protein RJ639_042133 [Escallonia herrerae]